MPPEGLPFSKSENFLSENEIITLVRTLTDMGIEKVRLTGGEPLLRKDILSIAKKLSKIKNLKDLALTTNGYFLKEKARALKDVGINRVNISIDSLDENNFAKITNRNNLKNVLEGIAEAIKEGFAVKLNAVVMKGINDHEIFDFIDFALNNAVEEVRFIEFMPLCGTGWKPEHVFDVSETIENIKQKFNGQFVMQDSTSVAESYLVNQENKSGRVGFIRTLSRPFCGDCSRIRVSATGCLRPCLFSHLGTELRQYLNEDTTQSERERIILNTVMKKEIGNEFYIKHEQGQKLEKSLESLTLKKETNPNILSIGG